MASLYNDVDIYDMSFTPRQHDMVRDHWQKLLGTDRSLTVLDCSIGTGNLTLPIAELGHTLSGSDLRPTMLQRCQEKAELSGLSADLRIADFRQLASCFSDPFDWVISTGNSLPHVDHEDVHTALVQMDALVKPGGCLYLDTRNWDRILREHQRFYFYPPYFRDEMRINIMQVWDYESDGSITFHLLYGFEKDQAILERKIFREVYHPISMDLLRQYLTDLGYRNIRTQVFPYVDDRPAEETEWYCMWGTKA